MKTKTVLTCSVVFIGLSSIVAFAGTVGLSGNAPGAEVFWQQIQSFGGFGMFLGTLAILFAVVAARLSKSGQRGIEFEIHSGCLYLWPLTRNLTLCFEDITSSAGLIRELPRGLRDNVSAVFVKDGQLTGEFVRMLMQRLANVQAVDLQNVSVDFERFEYWEEMVDLSLLVLPGSLSERQFRRLTIELPDVTLVRGPLAIEILNYCPDFAEETDLILAEFVDDDKKLADAN